MGDVKYFYSAGAMGYAGEGYLWHKLYNFPRLPVVSKTITLNPKKGHPYAILPVGKSVYNKVALHNVGYLKWYSNYYLNKADDIEITLSIAGTDDEIARMVDSLNSIPTIKAIELNFSCPNVTDHCNKRLPDTDKDIYLKLNWQQSPYLYYDTTTVKGIRLNSIPLTYCGGSGKVAQERNWEYIRNYVPKGFNVAGCSFTSMADIAKLKAYGCTEIGIGSIILTNPRLVEKLKISEEEK